MEGLEVYQVKFKLQDLRPEKTYLASVEIIENGTVQRIYSQVEEYAANNDIILLNIENRIYPVVKGEDNRVYYTKKKYTQQEAVLIPLMVSYMIVSTWLNIQQYALTTTGGIVFQLNISTTALLIMNFAMGIAWSVDRLQQQVNIIRLKKRYFVYESNFSDSTGNPTIVKESYVKHRGKRGIHVFLAFCAGFILPALLTNLELSFSDPLLYYGYWGIFGIIVLLILINWKVKPEINPKGTRLLYAPNLLKMSNDGEFEIVDAYKNEFESPQENFESLLTIDKEIKRELIKSQEVLTMQEIQKIQDEIFEQLKNEKSEKTVKEIVKELKAQNKKLHAVNTFLVHQVKLKDSEIQADKADLKLAEDLIEAHTLKASQFSEVKMQKQSIWSTGFGRLMIGMGFILLLIYGYLWYNDQMLLSGVTP